jgi:hypothetical protein
LTKFSALAAMPVLGAVLNKPRANAMEDTITFEIKFTGPLGFIPYKEYFQVYAPYTTFEHYPVISSDYNELLLDDATDYVVFPPSPAGSNPTPSNSPIQLPAPNPFDYAKKNCRIGITVPRPDILTGINVVKVNVDGNPQWLPSGVRFIYKNIPKNKPPVLKNGSANFDPQFKNDDPIWELNIRMIPENILDRCHHEAELSFGEVAKLCSVTNPPVLNYGEGPKCHALARGHRFGPGSDCQTLPIFINPR